MTVRFFDPKNEVNFSKFFSLSLKVALILPVLALVCALVLGINWGIDFAGGTEMQVQFSKPVSADQIRELLEKLGYEKHQVQQYGAPDSNEKLIRVERLATFQPQEVTRIRQQLISGFGSDKIDVEFNAHQGDRLRIRMPAPAEQDPEALSAALSKQQSDLATFLDSKTGFHLRRSKKTGDLSSAILRDDANNGTLVYNVQFEGVSDKIAKALSDAFGAVEIRRVEFVDSQVSTQLRTDGALAVLYAIIAILIYIAIRFDIFFSPGAVVALLQDTFAALLVFVLGRYEFDLPSVAALLTVVGVSINNTIVVYDRIRETVPHGTKRDPDDEQVRKAVNKAVNDTFSRTINSTITQLMTTIALWIFAGGVIKSFAMTLTVGLGLGAVSSTLAAPACYLFMRKHFGHKKNDNHELRRGLTREDKARGVV